jgi:hypothetical protein
MPLITYQEWMKQTARTGLIRSAELRAIDEAFLNYEKLGTPAAKRKLEEAFEAWKRKLGPGDAWAKSARNHTGAVSKLAALLAGRGDDDTAFSRGRIPEFMHPELINARLGVLYLFSRIGVEPNVFKLLLNGGIDVVSWGMKAGGVSSTVQSPFSMASKTAPIVGAAGGYLEEKLAPKRTAANVYLPSEAKPSVLAGPDATLVTSEQLLLDAARAEQLASRPLVQKIRDALRSVFDRMVDKIKDFIREQFGTVEGVAALIKKLATACLSYFAAEAAPFFKEGLELVSGVAKTIDAAVTRFRTWQHQRGVELNDGHPGIIVQSIKRAMNLSLFEGLWETLKGAGSIAMEAASFGGAKIVHLVIGIVELIGKFVWRLVECAKINKFCDMAREHWNNHLSDNSIHLRPFAFSEWFRHYALNIPFISVLTLNSNICGDKMRYLTLFNSGGGLISADQFQRGVRFLDELKPWGASYLAETGYKIRVQSNDPFVHNLVNTIAPSYQKKKTAFDYIVAAATA